MGKKNISNQTDRSHSQTTQNVNSSNHLIWWKLCLIYFSRLFCHISVISNIRHTSKLRDFGQNFILSYWRPFCVFVLCELTWVHNSIFHADKQEIIITVSWFRQLRSEYFVLLGAIQQQNFCLIRFNNTVNWLFWENTIGTLTTL